MAEQERARHDAAGRDSRMSEDEIDYNVMASFPASDPPSWTVGIGLRRRPHDLEGSKPSPADPTHQNEPTRPPSDEDPEGRPALSGLS